MASISYLWNNRARFKIGSRSFFRAYAKRLLLIGRLFSDSYRRFKLRMKGASISPLAEIGAISIQGRLSGFKVGDYSTLGKVEIALHANLSIGKRVVINDGVRILTASHCTSCSDWKQVESDIYIDDYAWIAVGATILPGVSIGKGAVVGACAVVSKSVPDFSIVVGNPGKIISKRRNSQLNYNPCTFLALNNAWLNG